MILRADSDSLSERDETRESISSMKMIEGLCSRAKSNNDFTCFSDSPIHFETKSADDTLKKVELLASVATALAKNVFPVPGGWRTNAMFFLSVTNHCPNKSVINILSYSIIIFQRHRVGLTVNKKRLIFN